MFVATFQNIRIICMLCQCFLLADHYLPSRLLLFLCSVMPPPPPYRLLFASPAGTQRADEQQKSAPLQLQRRLEVVGGETGRGVERRRRGREEKKQEETSRWRKKGEQSGKSRAARGKRSRSRRRREERGYSCLVFHLITAKGPRAAVRHIFFTIFFFSITNIN